MEPRPLNVFQRIMRVWEEVHPYNAAQVLHLEGVADLDKLATAWNQTMAAMGLGPVRVEGKLFRYECGNGAAQPVTVVDRATRLEDFVTDEMNRPFAAAPDRSDPCCPFRPFILQGDGAYHAGVVYQHWVADSVSIRMLLREWFLRLYDPAAARTRPVHIPHGGFWRYFGPARGGWDLGDGLLLMLRSATRFCNSRRIERDTGEFHLRYSLHPLPDGMIDNLHESARRQGVTLNDLFMAAMAQACDRHGANPSAGRCRDLALGTIVDLRPLSREDLNDTFGLFLGFTTLVLPPSALRDSAQLLRNIAAQNAWQKRCRASQASVLRMAVGLAQGLMLSPEQRLSFYRKYMPLAAGISNVNMNRSWAAQRHPSPLLDYIRVSPTGPMLPLVFTLTTIGHRLHVALTRRTALVDDARAAQLVAAFVDRLAASAAVTVAPRLCCPSGPRA